MVRRLGPLSSAHLALTILGVAIGATVAAVWLTDRLVVRPLPVRHIERLVHLSGLAYGMERPEAWWGQAGGLEFVSRYSVGDAICSDETSKRWLRVAAVSWQFFRVLGVSPLVGRDFAAQDEGSADRVAIVSERFWRSYMASNPDVLGSAVSLNGVRFRVIAVIPSPLLFPLGAEVWVPNGDGRSASLGLVGGEAIGSVALAHRDGWIGRLKEGVSPERVRSELEALLRLANTALMPKTGVSYGSFVGVTPLRRWISQDVRESLALLDAGAALILLLACANCLFFFIARSAPRRVEMAVRRALGAPPRAFLAQAASETAGLALTCAVSSALTASLLLHGTRSVVLALPVHPYRPPSFLYVCLTTVAVALPFAAAVGLPSFLLAAEGSLARTLTCHGRSPAPGAGRRLRRGLLVVEVAVAVVLAYGALLCTMTLLGLASSDLGYAPDRVISAYLLMPGDGDELVRQEVLDIASTTPGVRHAGLASTLPVLTQHRREREAYNEDSRTLAATTEVQGEYFGAMGISVLAGRTLRDRDEGVVVVNERLAKILGGGRSVVGREMWLGGDPDRRRIIGVVRNTRSIDQGERSVSEVYRVYPQSGDAHAVATSTATLVVSCVSACGEVAQNLLLRLGTVHGLTVMSVEHLGDRVTAALAPARVRAVVWLLYAVVAIVVTALGVGALASYSVVTRSLEVAVRVALGATPWRVVSLLMKETLTCTVGGVACGCATAAYGARPLLRGVIVDLNGSGTTAMTAAAAFVAISASLAALGPSFRAAKAGTSALQIH